MSLSLDQQPAIEGGDPGRFAIRLEFLRNLDPGFATPEEDLSWGRFQFWADGRNLCEYLARGEVHRGVEWYLLPLLEWLTANWDCLLHEQRLPAENAGDSAWLSLAVTNRPEAFDRLTGWDEAAEETNSRWAARHALRSCRAGGLFPDLVLRRWRHDVEWSWGESPLAGAPEDFRFLHGQGMSRLRPDEVAQPLHAVLLRAADLLSQAAPGSVRLAELQRRVVALADGRRQLTRAAILAGLGGTLAEWEPRWQRLREGLERNLATSRAALRAWLEPADGNSLCVSGSCEAAVMFGSASPTLDEADVLALAGCVINASGTGLPATWRESAVPPQPWQRERSPWDDGYRLAGEWAAHTGLATSGEGFVDLDHHLVELGVAVTEITLSDAGTTGLAVQPAGGAPRIFINAQHPKCRYPTGRRFVLAHELCHLLHDGEEGRDLALISGPWAPLELEKRANAFAAALLMPSARLREEVGIAPRRLDFASLLTVAKRLRVSPNALAHHLENVGLIDEATRDGLLDELENRQVTRPGE